MCKLIVIFLVFLINFISVSYGDVTNGTELISAFLVHRHGDRTPVKSSLPLAFDPDTLDELIKPYGLGQLTIQGRKRAYSLGKYIRHRYDSLLSPTYNHTEINIKSTSSTRTKMTALVAMAAVYPAAVDPLRWSDTVNWVPIPYDNVPLSADPETFFFNCPKYLEYSQELFDKSDIPEMDKYNDVLTKLSRETRTDITSSLLVYGLYDVYVSQMGLGMTLPTNLQKLFPILTKAAGAAIDVLYGNNDYVALEAGVLLREFLDDATNKLSGFTTPNLRIHSAHDVNVYSFLSILQLTPKQGVPKYASSLSLELRRVVETGQIVVLAVYKPTPEEKELYLQVEGCDLLCDFVQFQELLGGYSRSYEEWRDECLYTDEFVIVQTEV